MDKLNSMTIFAEVVKQSGFTAAAEKIGLSRAQLSKSVMQLEAHLGTRLLNRTTRRISLTETGRIYYERCQTILNDIDELECLASEQTAKPSGTLTISVPTSFGIFHLNQLIPAYLKRYPNVQISLSLTDRVIDVVDEGFDLALRISILEDSSLIARRIAPCKLVMSASPEYIKQYGQPETPQDLHRHQCLIYTNSARPGVWNLQGKNGAQSIVVKGALRADNGDALKEAAIAGLGIALLPTFIVGPDLCQGKLQQVLPDYCPADLSIYAVFPSRRYLSAKVRTFIDFLTEYFGDVPSWDAFEQTR